MKGIFILIVKYRTIGQGIKSFQIDCLNKADQSSSFVDNVKIEVVEPLRMLLSDHEAYIKSCANKMLLLENEIASINQKIQKAHDRYLSSLREAEETLYECEGFRRNPSEYDKIEAQAQEKLNVRMWTVLRALEDDQELYKGDGHFSVTFQNQYEAITKQMLEEFQKHEEQRIQVTKESLQKLLIYEVSMEQNRKYDFKQVNEAVEAINPQADINDIINKHLGDADKNGDLTRQNSFINDPALRLLPVEMSKSGWDKLFELYRAKYYGKEELMDYTRVVEETKLYIMRTSEKEYKQHSQIFQSLIQKIQTTSIESTLLEDTKKLLSNHKARWAFLDILGEAIDSGKPKLSQEAYKTIAHLILCFLDKGYQSNEIEQIGMSVRIAENMYWSDDKGNKESLIFAVKSHEVWRDTSFWQKLFRENVDLELRLERSRFIKEKQFGNPHVLIYQKELKERNAVTDKIMVYAKQMGKFGIDDKEIRGFIERNCKMFNVPFKVFEDLFVFLIDMIILIEETKSYYK